MRRSAAALCAAALALLACSGTVSAQPSPDLVAEPPAAGSTEIDVVCHVLADGIGDWRRTEELTVDDAALIARLTERDRELLGVYDAVCGSEAHYIDAETNRHADVLMIAFADRLQALGFFTAQREEGAGRVLLTSAAFRNQSGVLHVLSGLYYLRVEAPAVETDALPPDRRIAARLEVRLPEVPPLPRMMRLMPHGWINELTVSYAPTALLGEDFAPMALEVQRELGDARVRAQVINLGSQAEAQRRFTALLDREIDRGRIRELRGLGQDAYSSIGGPVRVTMLQDEFIAHVTGEVGPHDAEAVMRLLGILIRITRPLPEPPQVASAAARTYPAR